MSITKKEKQTIAYYNENAEKWLVSHSPDAKPSFWTPELKLFQKYVPQGSILEIGVGGAGEASEFIKKGYKYTGIDPADTLIDIAQKRFPSATFLKNSVYDFDLPPSSFDGFWCSATLLHVAKSKIDLSLQKIKHVMKPGALGFISLAEGKEEYYDAETGRYFYLYDKNEFGSILHRNNFLIEEQAIRTQNTSRTWLRSWLTFFVRVS